MDHRRCTHQHNTLNTLQAGDTATISQVNGGKKMQQRLALLGINQGTNLRVISNSGPITITTNHNTITIGRGMAHHIHIKKE